MIVILVVCHGGNPVKCSDPTTAADKVACFSNGGSLVTLLAPGAMITAGGYTMGGTSPSDTTCGRRDCSIESE